MVIIANPTYPRAQVFARSVGADFYARGMTGLYWLHFGDTQRLASEAEASEIATIEATDRRPRVTYVPPVNGFTQ